MMPHAASQQKQGGRATFFLWSTLLSLLLITLNAALLYVIGYVFTSPERRMNWGFLGQEDALGVFLQDLLFIFLLFFLVGLLNRRPARKAGSAVSISVISCLMSGLSLFILPLLLLSWIGTGEDTFGYLIFVFDGWVFLVIGAQVAIGILGAVLGRLCGSQLLHRRPCLDEAALR